LGKVRGKQRITRSVEERRFSARRAITGVQGFWLPGFDSAGHTHRQALRRRSHRGRAALQRRV